MDIATLAREHPALFSALIGSSTGGVVGGLTADEGDELRGALTGATFGGGVGAVTGLAADKGREVLENITPTQVKALALGGAAGGFLGGGYIRRHKSVQPWIDSQLEKAREDNKRHKEAEAKMSNKNTNNDEKILAQRVQAFDVGIDAFCKDASVLDFCMKNGLEALLDNEGLSKEAFAKVLGVDDATLLAPTMILQLAESNEAGK